MKSVRDFTGGEVTLEEMVPEPDLGVVQQVIAEPAAASVTAQAAEHGG